MTKKTAKILLSVSIFALILSAVYSFIFMATLGSLIFGKYFSFMGIKQSSFESNIVFWVIGFVIAIALAVFAVIFIIKCLRNLGFRLFKSKARSKKKGDDNAELYEGRRIVTEGLDDTKQDENEDGSDNMDKEANKGALDEINNQTLQGMEYIDINSVEYVDFHSLQPIDVLENPLMQAAEGAFTQLPNAFKMSKHVDIDTLFSGFSEYLKGNNIIASLENVRKVTAAVVSEERGIAGGANSLPAEDKAEEKDANPSDDLKEQLLLYIKENHIYRLAKTCEDCETSFFLDEESWKKLDKIEDWFRDISVKNGAQPYEIGNKKWREIEKYTSVYLSCGGKNSQALDNVVAEKLLPEIITGVKKKDGIEAFLKKVLGDECSVSLNALTRFALEL